MNSSKLVIITGANSGLGLDMTKLFLKNNYYVVGIDIEIQNLELLKEKFKSHIINISANISDEDTTKILKNIILSIDMKPYILINNAAFSCVEEPYSASITKKIIDTNLLGAISITNSILSNVTSEDIKIVNILSSVAYKGNINCVYTACKWGLRGFSESLKVKYKDTNVKIFNITPCSMNTPYWDNKPSTINRSKFSTSKYVAKCIYEHIISLNNQVDDYIIPKEN